MIVVIACGFRKAPEPTRARDLYTGPTFHLARAAAERDGRRWMIVSARHGLLDPDSIVAPYEQRLETAEDIRRLSFRVSLQPNPGPIEVWAPARYVKALESAGLTISALPLKGLRQGHQRHWFKEHAR